MPTVVGYYGCGTVLQCRKSIGHQSISDGEQQLGERGRRIERPGLSAERIVNVRASLQNLKMRRKRKKRGEGVAVLCA